ncbi:hypothetical protein [Citricoccus nitrophenolicus]|uniref:hypothetical protein n=1 Tax=Citricoccus nitrophenolicus TaxID=863575 RepID=UPI0031F14E3F
MGSTLVLVVDAANVVGSVPDGWWRDRRAATVLLRDHLALVAAQAPGPSGAGHPPDGAPHRIVLVTEGQARGVGPVSGVEVVEAPGEGDDEIVAVARREVESGAGVVVATADRELQSRLRQTGAEVMSAKAVRHRAG